MDTQPKPVFTVASAVSLGFVASVGVVGYIAARALLPKNTRQFDQYVFIWFVFDGLIHFSFEAAFLWYSLFGRTINTSSGFLADTVKEYSLADYRWGVADPTVVSLEILTVLGAGPLALYIAYLMVKGDEARHYWIVVISTAELYGGFMTFAPEWLTGSQNLNTSNPLYLWLYLAFFNLVWVFIPLLLMVDSYGHISNALRRNKQHLKLQ